MEFAINCVDDPSKLLNLKSQMGNGNDIGAYLTEMLGELKEVMQLKYIVL